MVSKGLTSTVCTRRMHTHTPKMNIKLGVIHAKRSGTTLQECNQAFDVVDFFDINFLIIYFSLYLAKTLKHKTKG